MDFATWTAWDSCWKKDIDTDSVSNGPYTNPKDKSLKRNYMNPTKPTLNKYQNNRVQA